MSKLAFIDTETTSLRPDRRAWDIGMIVRDDEDERDYVHWDNIFIDIRDLDLGNADPFSLKVGRFHERHPQMKHTDPVQAAYAGNDGSWKSELSALTEVERLTRNAYLVGANVRFDAEVLETRMRANGILPMWNYHLVDIQALALGYIMGAQLPESKVAPSLQMKSSDLSDALGVAMPTEDERHTALGDARWAMRVFDKVMGIV